MNVFYIKIALALKCEYVIGENTIRNFYILFYTCVPASGDQISSSGNELLPLPVLFLPDQSSKSALYV